MAGFLERRATHQDVTWTADTDSNILTLEPGSVSSVYLDASFAGTTLQVKTLEKDGSYVLGYYNGSPVSISVSAGLRHILPPEVMALSGKVKLVSNATETCTGRLKIVG